MPYQIVKSEDLAVLNRLPKRVKDVDDRYKFLVDWMYRHLTNPRLGNVSGTVIGEPSPEGTCRVTVPTGEGRLRREWGIGPDGVEAVVQVELKSLAPDDTYRWKAVWCFYVPEFGQIRLGDNQTAVDIDSTLNGGDAVATIVANITYALVAGNRPQTSGT